MKSGIGRRSFTDRREGKLMHKDINTKREREKAVVSEMIALYCR